MLVVLLIGLASLAVVMTFPNTLSTENNARWQAQRFATLLQLAEDEALISGNELGLVIEKNSYQFAVYDYSKQRWLAARVGEIEEKVELPELIRLEYSLSDSVWGEISSSDQDSFIEESERVDIEDDNKLKTLNPPIYVMSSGEVSPFSLVFSKADNDPEKQSITVSVSMNGAISLTELSKE
ncbi:general secretion pathway protein H [Psychromonas ingrahamii 37]|uniref:General secretion pathway protein H n=2 Tax=Psychromonas ingrahamii TaxID=357794 RepID=A1SR60_PSYIN|nr:general secretion pathway protein H [Psychromonas ingrahamii 37]